MADQFNIFDQARGVALRDAGMARTTGLSPKWAAEAMAAIIAIPRGWQGMGEDIRVLVGDKVGHPHHPNCWGALIMGAMRKGLLVKTGVWKGARAKASHASQYPVLRRV